MFKETHKVLNQFMIVPKNNIVELLKYSACQVLTDLSDILFNSSVRLFPDSFSSLLISVYNMAAGLQQLGGTYIKRKKIKYAICRSNGKLLYLKFQTK